MAFKAINSIIDPNRAAFIAGKLDLADVNDSAEQYLSKENLSMMEN